MTKKVKVGPRRQVSIILSYPSGLRLRRSSARPRVFFALLNVAVRADRNVQKTRGTRTSAVRGSDGWDKALKS